MPSSKKPCPSCGVPISAKANHCRPCKDFLRTRTGCEIPGCERKHYGRGWCQLHYTRWMKHGDPTYVTPKGVRVAKMAATNTKPQWDRFWGKVDASGLCWLWTGATAPNGYGTFGWDGRRSSPKTMVAHRASWLLLVGSIPDGLVLDHLCMVRNCVNPDHLQPVTQAENVRRSWAAQIGGRAAAALRYGVST